MWTARLPSARVAALALAACFSFTGLGNHPLRASDEPRVAGIAWTMQHEGRWLVPYLGDAPFLEHPPLYYALLGGFLKALGASDGVARLPSALAAFFALWLCFELGQRLAGSRAGLAALLVLVGTRGFFRYSHKVLVDPLLTLCVLIGYVAYLRAAWRDAPGPGGELAARSAPVSGLAVLGIYAAASLAFGVKGLVGLVVLGGPIALDVLRFRGLRFMRSWGHAVGIPLLVGACVAYPALLYREAGPAAFREFAVQNSLLRIFPTAELGPYAGGHVNPFWYYLPRIFEQLGWTAALAPGALAWILRGARADWNAPALRFLAWVFPIGVLLLSIPGTKRGLYLLPLVPPFAVVIGAWIAALTGDDPRRSRLEAASAALCAGLVNVLAWPLARLLSGLGRVFARAQRGGARLASRVRSDLRAAATGAVRAPLRIACIGFVASVAWNLLGYPHGNHDRDLGPVAREIVAMTGPGPVTGYLLPEDIRGAIPFYTGHGVHSLRSEEEVERFVAERPDGFLLVGKRASEELGGGALARVRIWRKAEGSAYILLRVTGSRAGRDPEYSAKTKSPSASSEEAGGSSAAKRA